MKRMRSIVIFGIITSLISCGDPGASLIKDGEYRKAAVEYTKAISNEFADSKIIEYYCSRAIAYAKMGNTGAAWGSWKMARLLNAQILNSNKGKREANILIANTAKNIKIESQNAQRNRQRQIAATIEKQKPQIYERGLKYYRARNYIAALREFNKIPNYRNSRAIINNLRTRVRATVNRLWQQGFALFSAESYSQAIRIFKKILEINPSHRNARIYLEKSKAKLKALRRF